jgi:hypothetical protein
MNNPTLLDKLTGQIPGKTEGTSLITILVGVIGTIAYVFFGVTFSQEMLNIINLIAVGGIGLALGSRTSRVEKTVNQVQAAQTESAPLTQEKK